MGHKIRVDTKILKVSTLLTLFKMEGNNFLPHKNHDNYYNMLGRGMISISRSIKNKYRSVPVLFENPVCLSAPFYRSQLLTDFLLIFLLFGVSPNTLGFGSPMRTFRKYVPIVYVRQNNLQLMHVFMRYAPNHTSECLGVAVGYRTRHLLPVSYQDRLQDVLARPS